MGYFHVYTEKEDYGIIPNHFVDSGKIAFMDTMLNSNPWNTNYKIYLAVGNSTNTNAGVNGPTSSTPVAKGGNWLGPDNTDWKLTHETSLQRIQMTCYRVGKVCYLRGKITNTELVSGNIHEIGIFLSDTAPGANPVTTIAQRANAMLVRAIRYLDDGTNYIANPIVKSDSVDVSIDYVFGDMA
jgi:hypothetical protein